MSATKRIEQLKKHIATLHRRIKAGRYTSKTITHLNSKQSELALWQSEPIQSLTV